MTPRRDTASSPDHHHSSGQAPTSPHHPSASGQTSRRPHHPATSGQTSRRPHHPATSGPAPRGASHLHPYTPVTIAAALMISIAVLNTVWASAAGVAVAGIAALASRRLAPVVAALALAIPAALSFVLMYGLFGQWATAGELSLRFAALVLCGLVFGAMTNLDALMRALQLRLPAPMVYIIGSVVRLLPMAHQRVATVRQIQRSRGLKPGRFSLVVPVIVGLITDAAARSRPLQRSGIATPGPRTVLYPVQDRTAERAARWLLLAATLGCCVWAAVGA